MMDAIGNQFVMVLPYYGALPSYFSLWAESLAHVNMDVLLVTDLSIPENVPSNLRVLKLSLDDVRRLTESKLGSRVALTHPRKLCDLRPFYGLIFEDYINGYTYWGFGDCDLIYGRKLNDILLEILKGSYDVASFKRGRISGGLSFVRNTPEMRSLALELDDWQAVLNDERNFLLDEIRNWLRFKELDSGHCTLEDIRREDGDSFSAIVWRTSGLKIFSKDLLLEKRLYFYSRILMDHGVLKYNGEEIVAFHYVGVKSFKYFNMDSCLRIFAGNGYAIDACGFHSRNESAISLFYLETAVIFKWLPSVLLRKLKFFIGVLKLK